MRLINVHSLEMKEFYGIYVPRYMILSHRWQEDEISYQDFEVDKGRQKSSFHKLEHLCQLAQDKGVDWVWSDTCCIDKRNSAELSEAINSMYKWYEQSQLCVAYLCDIDDTVDKLGCSMWFTRCWTLQELIAPAELEFYDKAWNYIGRKSDMCEELSAITKIDKGTLAGADPRRCSIAQRMSWAAGRQATRIEDEAYSLLGLFNVSMPMLYGDGERTFLTLQERIAQVSDDQSILAWDIKLDRPFQNVSTKEEQRLYGLLANSPSAFASCGNISIVPRSVDTKEHLYSFSVLGIQLTLPTKPVEMHCYQVALDCTDGSDAGLSRPVIIVRKLEEEGEYARIDTAAYSITTMSKKDFNIVVEGEGDWDERIPSIKKMHVRQHIRGQPLDTFNGMRIQIGKFECMPDFLMKKTLVYSRDGRVIQPIDEEVLTRIPVGKFGTSAIIVPPASAFNCCILPVQYIQLGFDADSHPFCVVRRQDKDKDVARMIGALYRETDSLGDKEPRHSQASLENLEKAIQYDDQIAMNVNSDDAVTTDSSSNMVHEKYTFVRALLSFHPIIYAAKAPRSTESSTYFSDQELFIGYSLVPSETDQQMIWKVEISSRRSYNALNIIPAIFTETAKSIAYGLSRFNDSPSSLAQRVGKKICGIADVHMWLFGYIERCLWYFPIQFGLLEYGIIFSIFAALGFLGFIVVGLRALYNPSKLTADDVESLLNGTVQMWSAFSGTCNRGGFGNWECANGIWSFLGIAGSLDIVRNETYHS